MGAQLPGNAVNIILFAYKTATFYSYNKRKSD